MGSYLSERSKIVGCLAPKNVGSTYWVSQPVKLDSYQKATMIIYLGATDGPRNVVMYAGNTSTVNTAIPFAYGLSNGTAANVEFSSALSAATTAGISISNTTYPTGSLCVIEVTAQSLANAVGTNAHFIGVNVGANGTTGYAAIVTILSDARFPEASNNTATVLS